MTADKESTIIPCSGRYLPEACYIIEVKFTNRVIGLAIHEISSFAILLLVLVFTSFLIYKKTKHKKTKQESGAKEKLGSFYFYPEQNKLVKEAQEIALSKKECELLALFVANPNQIIKRDELTKRVWEDNGVFVGRSLDTYISKLRKKLKADTSIKLTNIHGVGYKLELNTES
jgi:DNA-binding response OmpR family regulator